MKKSKIHRPRITDVVKRAVAELRQGHPDWTVKQIHGALAGLTGVTAPGIRSVYKLVKKSPQNTARFEETEQLWHLGLLSRQEFRSKYPELTAEAIRHIFEAQKAARDFFERIQLPPAGTLVYQPMSVRTALWVARLYEAVRMFWTPDEHFQYDLMLYCVSMFYSYFELISELSRTPFDTLSFDEALRNREKSFFDDVKEMLYGRPADDPISQRIFNKLKEDGETR